MKILAIGDFHGRFPEKLFSKIRKEKFDLIISTGDFCGNKELGKLFFRYVYGTDKRLEEFIGKKKTNQLDKKNFEAGIEIMKKLSSLNAKIIAVRGNWDPQNFQDIGFSKEIDMYSKRFLKEAEKNDVEIIDFKNTKYESFNFIGYPRSTYPGKITKKIKEKLRKRNEKKVKERIRKTIADNKKYFQMFNKISDNKTIFIIHNCPYNTKLDKIKKGIMKGEHYGSWLAKLVIKKLKPKLAICGHMHENQGKCKIGKTIVVNPGAAYDG
ncbi:MAG: metallophosphoesterase family protein, partial [Candidatus Pacearchaeota archaeon]|nr:metallophosphoesterase family protein [Candidatus Pacearchaeota archaeon]